MGFYGEQVLPRLIDRACGTRGLRRWRTTVTEGLAGRVVEIGFGSGLNLDFYPPDVELVLAVEPAAVARKLADRRASRSGVKVEHIGLDGQTIPLDDDSCDGGLSTFTLCTIPDPHLALAELRAPSNVGMTVARSTAMINTTSINSMSVKPSSSVAALRPLSRAPIHFTMDSDRPGQAGLKRATEFSLPA